MLAEWNNIAPFGAPVVPDVNRMSHKSSVATSAARGCGDRRIDGVGAREEVRPRCAAVGDGAAKHDDLLEGLGARRTSASSAT